MTFFNRYFDKNRLKALVLWSLTRSGEKKTIDLVEKLKDLGFHYATQAGLSLSIDDLKIPTNKPELILEAELIIESSQKEYESGNLTVIEKFQQMIDVWHRTSEILKQNVIQNFKLTDILNPVYMMAFSGARGNISQVRQLVGMRGLMADPQGQILDFPIRSNFREGLTLTEYVISCYGARKGLVDTALRTANSGYLTRRLVDVAQHIIVRQLDCGTTTGILVSDMKDGKKIILSLQKRLIGRVLAESIDSIAFKNQDISPSLAAKIVKLKKQVLVRSPLTCEAKNSVCQLCYGWSLAHGNLVSLGEAVGILAAQSIGEPGTQLTMRTFHTGGVFSGDVMQEIRSPISGKLQFSSPLQGTLIRTLHGKIAFLTKMEGNFSIINSSSQNYSPISYHIPTASILFARHLENVQERQLLAEFSSFLVTNNQGIQAKYNLNSEKEGQVYFENVLLVVKVGKEGDVLRTSLKFGSIWILAGKLYQSQIRSILFPKSGDLIDTKSILNESTLVTPYNGFFEVSSIKKQKLINKKFQIKGKLSNTNSRKNQILFLNHLLKNEKIVSDSVKNYSVTKEKNLRKELNLKQPIGTVFIKNINYKKFGYFISLEQFQDIKLFYTKGLFTSPSRLNEISFYLFDTKSLKKSTIYFHDKNKLFYQKAQYFFRSENIYKLLTIQNSKESKLSIKKTISKKQYLKSQRILIYKKNLQGNQEKLKLKSNQFLDIKADLLKKEKTEKQNLKLNLITKKTVIYQENPYRKESSPLKKYIIKERMKGINLSEKQTFNSKLKNIYFFKKCLLPTSIFFKNSIYRKYDLLQPVNFLSFKKEKYFITFKCKVNAGWIALPKTNSKFFFLNKNFSKPGNYKNFFQFDQKFSFLKIIPFKKRLYFLKKNTSLKKIRYITNKLTRINKIHKKSKNWKKNTLLILQKSIKTNKIYLINFCVQTNFLICGKKLNELNYQNKTRKNILFKNFSNNLYLVKFYKINSFLCNKQKLTKIKSTNQTIDFEIKSTWIKKQSNSNTPTILIFFKTNKYNALKQAKVDFSFPINLNISIIRKINPCNFLGRNNLNNEKLLLTNQKIILEQTPLSFTSFSSPYSGEMTRTKKDITGKQKSLLLTKNDQITFRNDQKNSLIKIGQLLRYGDRLNSKTAIQESGQIIQIDKNKITLRKAKPILYSSKGVFHVDNGDIVEKNAPLITLFYQKLKTEDIVQGIPKIEELFEARQTKEGETLQENLHTKLHLFFNYYKQQFTSQEAARKSIEKIQQILVNNVQKVYQSQGVTIADKHIEIIVRQMTTKVKITKSGRTGLLRGELIDLEWVEIINLGIEAQNELIQQGIKVEKAEYEPIILGITKAALETESFISASSFQETTRILSKAAIERKTDFLRGLKENVILGHLIPAGTGFRLSFNPQLKIINHKKKLSWLSYKDILKVFSQ